MVIGGGVIGCATAWQLARRGASVVLFEAGSINSGASGQNAGSLHFQIERRFIEAGEGLLDQAAQIVHLNRLAIEDWRTLEAETNADLHVRMVGGLMVAETAEELSLLESKVQREQAHGLSNRLIDGDAARDIAPYLGSNILAASYAPDEGHADPRALTPALAESARREGADIRTGAEIIGIDRRDGLFTVQANQGGDTLTVRSRMVLAAAGAWTSRVAALANLHVPLFPVALLMNASERTRPFIPHLIQHVGRRLSMKQTYAGNVLIGGGWPSRMGRSANGLDPGVRPDIIPTSVAGNLKAAVDVVPEVASLNLIRSWTGVTAISADQLPIVGEVPRLPGFYVAAGGSAFTLGPTFARLLAEAMSGRPHDALQIVSPARFEHLNSFMGIA